MKWHIIVNEKGHSLPEMFKLEKGTMQNSMLIHFDISIHCMVFWKKTEHVSGRCRTLRLIN